MRIKKDYARKHRLLATNHYGTREDYVDMRYFWAWIPILAAVVGITLLIRWPIVALSHANQEHVKQCDVLSNGYVHYLHTVGGDGGTATCTVIINQKTFQTHDWQF